MAEDKDHKDEESPIKDSGDSGLGNLPPLSDFDSNSGLDSDGGLPPLGSFESETADEDDSGSGGLPPIGDIQVETPQPVGGGMKQPPKGFDSNVNDTFSSGSPGGLDTPGIDTPAHDTPSAKFGDPGTGFQDLAADSDFSPETPEIGPGPDSNVDTPMFDSAFGAGESGFGVSSSDTPAPTQAMETPMFGASAPSPAGGGGGFDAGAFGGDFSQGSGGDQFGGGGSGGDFGMGTPAPDFSPDTEAKMAGGKAPKKSKGGKGGGGSPLVVVGAALVALIIGIVASPFVSGFLSFLPNPARDELAAEKAKVVDLEARVREYIANDAEKGRVLTQEQLDELEANILAADQRLKEVTASLQETETAYNTLSTQYDNVQSDLDDLNVAFADAEEIYEELLQQTAITEARQKGLLAEVSRLTRHVGELDDANQRRAATLAALSASTDRLYVQVRESMPLTPEKYSYDKRMAAVSALRDQVSSAKWVTPALQNAYTDVYLKELEISQAKEYFFAKIMVTDPLGIKTAKWAECVMNGNWSVDYRTFDGKNIGTFQNVAMDATPEWAFVEGLEKPVQKEIEGRIFANRVPDFAEKIAILVEREAQLNPETEFQKAFSSL